VVYPYFPPAASAALFLFPRPLLVRGSLLYIKSSLLLLLSSLVVYSKDILKSLLFAM